MRVNRQPAADAGRATRRATDDRIPGELHDFIGIGLGPFNLGLACLAEPIAGLRGLFLERRAGFDWHPGMLIDDTTLQNPFLADLVSLADPKNRFSFLNYCKQEGKLHAFFIRERFYLGRAEFNRYCQWAAAQLDNIVFDADVEHITHDEATGLYTVAGRHPRTLAPFAHRAPKLVIGVGSSPSLPKCCEPSREHCIHSAHYLDKKAYLQSKRSIAVIGSGQSAAEIFLDLLEDSDTFGYRLTWITRSPRFLPMETTKLTLELTSPDYLDYLNSLSDETRERILSRQDALYKGINATLINRIYDRLDERRHDGRRNVVLATNAELVDCRYDESASRYHLQFIQRDEGLRYTHLSDAAIFATGHAHPLPRCIDGIRERIDFDAAGRYRVSRNHAIDGAAATIFVHNAAPHSHGLLGPDLGMGCYRNAAILRAITGVEHYVIDTGTTLQDFSIPEGEAFIAEAREPA